MAQVNLSVEIAAPAWRVAAFFVPQRMPYWYGAEMDAEFEVAGGAADFAAGQKVRISGRVLRREVALTVVITRCEPGRILEWKFRDEYGIRGTQQWEWGKSKEGTTRVTMHDEFELPQKGRLAKLAERFDDLHERYETCISVGVDATARAAPAKAREPQAALEAGDDPNVAHTKDITVRFDAKRCIHSRHCVLEAPTVFLANTKGAWLHPETTSVEHIVRVAHECPSGAITYERHDGGPQEKAPQANVICVRENGPYAVSADIALLGDALTRATLCRCGQSKSKPFCDNSHIKARFAATGEPQTIPSDPLEFRGGRLSIEPLPDGPLHVMGNVEICAGTGRTVNRVQNARLCRCGGSSTKPFCDGTHARIGFKS